MKITDIKVYIMDAYRTNWTFLKVETDEGTKLVAVAAIGETKYATFAEAHAAAKAGDTIVLRSTITEHRRGLVLAKAEATVDGKLCCRGNLSFMLV